MTNQNGPSAGTEMVLSPRQEKLQTIRDEMGPGARPAAIVPRTFVEAQQMCGALARSGLVPVAYADKPENMIVTIMAGAEIGIPPMASLRLYHIMDSVPRLSAEGIRAVLLAHPEIEYFEPQSCSETSATWIGKRRNRPEKSATWTIDRAKRAGLTEKRNRDGSPGNWIKYPEDMLNARASMQLGRMIAPDVVAGMVSLEEARDGDFIDANFTETKAPVFVAPPVVPAQQQVTVQLPTGTTVTPDAPRRGPGRPPKDPTTPVVPQPSSASTGPSTSTATTSSTPPSPSGASASATPEPSKLDAAIAKVEAKANPTPADSGTGPTAPPPAESAAASTAPTTSGVATAAADDSGFGGDDEKPVLADFFAWVASCKTQRDLQAGLGQWRTWSQEKAKAGDTTFSKTGANTIAMQDAYSRRKGEVPA